MNSSNDRGETGAPPWFTRTVAAIVLATFFSDASHEMCTAVLPLYLGTVGLGPAALGLIEGVADFLVSISKLAGGIVGHHLRRKRPWTAAAYLLTALATWGIAFATGLAWVMVLRSAAWIGRGFRSPLRDFLLADAVEPRAYGRAYGLERAGDMLGAVTGPLLAALLLFARWDFREIILWTLIPGLLASAAFFFFTTERHSSPRKEEGGKTLFAANALPRSFWLFLGGVFLFGLGDFSRTFLVYLAAEALGEVGRPETGAISAAVLLYMMHNLVSAAAAYPAGRLGDRYRKPAILISGYALGVGTNVILAVSSSSLGWLITAIVLSGVYIAIEETLEKAVAAELLPRELRSLGFGILACANAVGDMVSSVYVGYLLQSGFSEAAFGVAAVLGGIGAVWMAWFGLGRRAPSG